MNQRAYVRAAVAGGSIALAIVACGCGSSRLGGQDGDGGDPGPSYSSDGGATEPDAAPSDGTPVTPAQFDVTLVPDGAAGVQRVNFAIPFSPGVVADANGLRVVVGGSEWPAARRVLARHADGSARSVQLQLDVDVGVVNVLSIELAAPAAAAPSMVPVASTLTGSGNQVRPRVWAVLPTAVHLASGLAGPLAPAASVAGTPLAAWQPLCDYDRWGTDAFLVNASASRDVWLYDRVTAMYRGHIITGRLSPLRSAYREAEIYRAGMTISNGITTNIAVPNAQNDLKYHYAQGLALHYLLTGDDRFREAAEAVSARVAALWNPQYDGSDRFWTERHAGFALLAHEWAMRVTDDQAAAIGARASSAVDAFLAVQASYPSGYADPDARCFAHQASAHGEGYGYAGCSPWMSAILADGLDAHARRVGGSRAAAVRASLVKLGRILARDGRDASGKPYYWMGVGTNADEVDGYDEHWGESAYVIALAWDATGRTEAALETAADQLVAGLGAHGVVGQLRSFNWQCRSAVMTPALLE